MSDCPACRYGFLHRRRGRCPHCKAILVKPGEKYVNDENDRVFLLAHGEWMEMVET